MKLTVKWTAILNSQFIIKKNETKFSDSNFENNLPCLTAQEKNPNKSLSEMD